MSRAPTVLFALILALAAAAGVALALGCRPVDGQERRAREFHGLVGGLGFGPTVDQERCEFSFDPRLCPACSNDCGPVPGGMFFCPQHACSILEYPAMREQRTGQGQGDP